MKKSDELSIAMQNEVVKIAEERLQKRLPFNLVENIRKPWSYKGLEMIIDTVRTIDLRDLENYLTNLDQ
jgi:hypothetical protein